MFCSVIPLKSLVRIYVLVMKKRTEVEWEGVGELLASILPVLKKQKNKTHLRSNVTSKKQPAFLTHQLFALSNYHSMFWCYVCFRRSPNSPSGVYLFALHVSALGSLPLWHLQWRRRWGGWQGRNETGGWSKKGEQGRGGGKGTGGGAVAFIFSLPHVIFIVNKTHLAFLSEQGLAGEASILAEKQAVGWEGGGELWVKSRGSGEGVWNKVRRGMWRKLLQKDILGKRRAGLGGGGWKIHPCLQWVCLLTWKTDRQHTHIVAWSSGSNNGEMWMEELWVCE